MMHLLLMTPILIWVSFFQYSKMSYNAEMQFCKSGEWKPKTPCMPSKSLTSKAMGVLR